MEIAEEEALQHRMIMEEQLREAMLLEQAINEQQAILQSQNLALKSQSPQPPSQQVQDGQYSVNAGAGGTPPLDFFVSQSEMIEIASFSVTPSSGIGPLTVNFTNLSISPSNDKYFWDFGSGSLTSAQINPPAVTYTQTGSYTIKLQETSSTGNSSSVSQTILVSPPTLVSSFTFNTSSNTHPSSASFVNTTTYNGSGTLIYLWDLGTGSVTTASFNPQTQTYANSGSYTASLQVTESSYNITSISYVSWSIA
jgi:PKD repeat protein